MDRASSDDVVLSPSHGLSRLPSGTSSSTAVDPASDEQLAHVVGEVHSSVAVDGVRLEANNGRVSYRGMFGHLPVAPALPGDFFPTLQLLPGEQVFDASSAQSAFEGVLFQRPAY